MMKYVKMIVTGFALFSLGLSPSVSGADQLDTALYTFCVANWNAEGLGATFFKIARDHHCHLGTDSGEESALFWQDKGREIFQYLPSDPSKAPLLCAIYIESALQGFTGNQPLCHERD